MDYKGHRIEATSYQLVDSGRWVPQALVHYPTGGEPVTTALTAFAHEQDTQAAADDYAVTMAQQWIDGKV
jgi:hypothetical protein